ncbi:small acid-soluble spore protein Tlp [Paenibacillus sp. TRM 82003]|nr:small acid-soluble spore protein Tlp [Paenibacillus sp. TRM 82003]
MARPDGRTENVKRLNKQVKHTIENLNEAQEYLQEHAEELAPQEAASIEAKNERRRANVDNLEDEMEEERRLNP